MANFGVALGENAGMICATVANIYVAFNSSRACLFALVQAFDRGHATRFDAAGAIWPVERYYRDAKLLDIGAGTNEIRRMLIGSEVIGA